ncbi:DNA repair protein Rad50 [Clostridium neonatale]|uniref:DNA repair protein Rad50 n=1 Tax=Clostridium neonatale TaxID=137838 RepID=UPI003D344D4E
MNLDELLKEYKDMSFIMIRKIRKEEEISSFLRRRENIIDEINNLNIDKQLICSKIEDLNIMDIEKELEELIKSSMLNVKKEIKKVKQSKEAYKKYADFNGNPVIFSTKR